MEWKIAINFQINLTVLSIHMNGCIKIYHKTHTHIIRKIKISD